MPKEIVWLERTVIAAVHARLLADHGGATGVRDAGMLESALARPRNLAAYEAPDICSLAAAYAAGIVRNHPFVDGNKRIAFMAAYIFLARNGRRLRALEEHAARIVLALAANEIAESDFAQWLRENSELSPNEF